ncbi:uncharacterized protein LOC100678715 isoform X2 [Nasonia vitripennis]|uniref:Uncharacterized protein n=1 Tax=Nasonia vitripennis TaxID=7425 RepID=A0A7M7Q8G6_NASVI|nr:uncharacterized protein LOC100678715 isoform X2 [Nasonia vitripennis]
MKMAPGPDHQRQEPVAPDKSSASSSSNASSSSASSSAATAAVASTSSSSVPSTSYSSAPVAGTSSSFCPSSTAAIFLASEAETSAAGNQEAALPILNNAALVDSKQEEPATLSTLNEGELRALLDEAITYKCPKDREGKSNLFKKGLSEEKSAYDWTNKEKSKSLDKPSYDRYSKKEEKEKDKKDIKLSGSCDIESELRDKRNSNRVKLGTNEMLESDNPPPVYNKQDCIEISLDDFEESAASERNASAALGGVQRPRSLDAEDDEGTEMKVIDHRRHLQFISRATIDIPQTPVDSTIEFPTFREHTTKLEKSKINANGTEGTSSLPFPPYNNNIKCVMSGPPNVYSVMSWPSPNISMVSRLTAQHIAGKESSLSGEKKSLDENGNSVQNYNGERKKSRRKNAQEPNVIVYQAENVKGHRDDDIDSLLSFIENKECKSKKGKTSNTVKVKTASNTKSRSRDNKDIKREQIPTKLQKSNSLEEISKTKLEDLTTEQSATSSGSSSVSSQHGSINIALRRAKQRSTGDATAVDSRGDRRSWGTEEGQAIYCNDTGDDYSSRRNSVKKANTEHEAETEFHVVTNKKKKTKKQRRSSSGGRAQNLSGSGSYLQRGRGFSNDYRTPLSPELRRKSASSMPPSDKSDSSDLDSVHSLPVTSNSKHNSSKTATSSSNAPQASYADIARMATLNMSGGPVINISNLMPSMINTTWPSVASSKSNAETEKLPNDYYPSLDELQHSDRKIRQHNFSQQGGSLSLDKPPSPTMPKSKTSPESSKKTEAQDEAIIKVVKYVQDIEKMQQSQLQQENKQSSNNSSPNSNETTPTNPLPPKIPEPLSNYSPSPDSESNSNGESSRDSSANSKNNGTRVRKNHSQNSSSGIRDYPILQTQKDESRDTVKISSSQLEENVKPSNSPNQSLSEDREVKKMTNVYNTTAGSSETIDSTKSRITNNIKPVQQFRPSIDTDTIRVNKIERLPKASKDQSQVNPKDTSKVSYQQQTLSNRQDKPVDDTENKKSKQSNSTTKLEKEQKVPEIQMLNKSNSSTASITSITSTASAASSARPAVILLDENIADQSRSLDSEFSELTFGFEVNEQLLLSEEEEEEEEETPTASPDLSRFSNSPPNFSRQPPMFDKHVRVDKFNPNFPMNPYIPVHPMPSIMVQTMSYMGCPVRFQGPYVLPHPHPSQPVIEKCRNQPKEDFSSRYIAPDESHVQNFNHDKIVSFVGLAWDDVMRETGSASSGRVQYYSGQ